MLTLEQARERVALGAAHLDIVKPNWFNLVDTDTLKLSSCQRCVIGQLSSHDSFLLGLLEFHIVNDREVEQLVNNNRAAAYGFAIYDDQRDAFGVTESKEAFAKLQDAWIEVIAERRCAKTVDRLELVEEVC